MTRPSAERPPMTAAAKSGELEIPTAGLADFECGRPVGSDGASLYEFELVLRWRHRLPEHDAMIEQLFDIRESRER